MKAPVLTEKQIINLKEFSDKKDYKGGWKYLASLGDSYADNAAVVTGEPVNKAGLDYLMQRMVQHIWINTVGWENYSNKFESVAARHFENYVRLIKENDGVLPKTHHHPRAKLPQVVKPYLSVQYLF
ncbi:hypothetical protein VQ643_16110 [Pseudomonas sp. F1_0610]|uniref:hypothetical protein n=1 Tax=Pseudomonas sp. F1_0610 TaxID=3114284 RepID=UPI0039C1DA19